MVTAWQQDRKRKQAAQLKSESVAGLEMLIGGVSDLDARQRAEAERKRKTEADAAALALKTSSDTAKTATEKSRAEANVLREKRLADDEAARNGERTARADVLRKKGAAEAQKQAMEALKARARGGASEVDLRNIAMNDEALGSLDDDAVRSVMLEAQGEERKAAEAQAGAEAKREATERSNRPKPAVLKPKKEPSDYDKRMAAARLDKIEAEAKTAKAIAAGDGPKEKVEAGTIKEVGELDATMRGIQDLQRRNPSVGTGFFRAIQNSIAQSLGIDDPKATKYRADIANLSNEIISRLSGANVPPAEMERIAQGLPDYGDDDAAYTEKLNATMERVDRARKGLVGAAKAANRDTAGLEALDPTAPTPKATKDMTIAELEAELAGGG